MMPSYNCLMIPFIVILIYLLEKPYVRLPKEILWPRSRKKCVHKPYVYAIKYIYDE